MNAKETGQLLGLIAFYDYRQVDEGVIVAWQAVLHDIPLAAAREVVTAHYRRKSSRIMPADIVNEVAPEHEWMRSHLNYDG